MAHASGATNDCVPSAAGRFRIGLDLGGTKIAATAITPDGVVMEEQRVATPRDDYLATLSALGGLAAMLALQAPAGADITVGIGMPGSISRRTGLARNANSTWLNGRPFAEDAAKAIGYPLRIANDANCLALSEAHDGAGAVAPSLFAAIIGTGCGGGLFINGGLAEGHLGIAGEWGHNPLPWPDVSELAVPACWCGRQGCIETWVSGPGLSADHHRVTGMVATAEQIMAAAAAGDSRAGASRERFLGRLARGLAHVINIADPAVIVLGGGLSKVSVLYERLPRLIQPFVFSDAGTSDIRPARWGDASGVRGAARLWPG